MSPMSNPLSDGCIYVVIEIPRGSRNKYEIDHETGRARERTGQSQSGHEHERGHAEPDEHALILSHPPPAG